MKTNNSLVNPNDIWSDYRICPICFDSFAILSNHKGLGGNFTHSNWALEFDMHVFDCRNKKFEKALKDFNDKFQEKLKDYLKPIKNDYSGG